MPSSSRYIPDAALVLTTLIWGTTFLIAKDVLTTWTPLAYLTLRFTIAGVAFVLLFPSSLRNLTRAEVKAGIVLGAIIGSGFTLQAAGQVYTTVAKSAFITSLTTPLVPLLAFTILRTRPSRENLFGVIIASIGGVVMLAPREHEVNSSTAVNIGDLLTLACTLLFATHIVLIERYARQVKAQRLAVLQVVAAALLFNLIWLALRTGGLLSGSFNLSAGEFVVRESQPLVWSASVVWQLVYLGLVGTVVTFLLWTWGQARMSATHAAIIFSLEPVFATGFAVLVRGREEWTGGWMSVGAALILAGVLLSELRWSRRSQAHDEKTIKVDSHIRIEEGG